MQLAIDLDGVVYPFVNTFAEFIHDTTGHPKEDMSEPAAWNFWDQWKLGKEKWLACFEKYGEGGGFLRGQPEPQSIEALKAQGHGIHILTARGCHWSSSNAFRAAVKRDTVLFLATWDVPYDSLLFSHSKEIINADLFLDDCEAHLEDIKKAGKRAVAFDQLHNRGFCGERVYDWTEFYDLVEKRGRYLEARL